MSFDAVVIGAGHNGLVCAAYLAKHGQRVLVVESQDRCGGLASQYEFHDGYRCANAQHVSHFPERISKDLNLVKHGFDGAHADIPLTWLNPDADGAHIALVDGHLSGVDAGEQAAYQQYRHLLRRIASMLAPFWLKTVPPIGNNHLSEMMSFAHLGLKMRALGKDDMREFLRIVALPIRDLLDEYFDHPGLKAMLSWDALIGSRQAPRSPNNSLLALLYRMADRSLTSARADSLICALEASARASGVEIRLSKRVERVTIEPRSECLCATGVELADGEHIEAARVVSSADPKTTLLQLVGGDQLEIEFAGRINRIRDRGLVSKLHLALRTAPTFVGLEAPRGRFILAPMMDSIEWAFDDAKYGRIPQVPVLEVTLPSLADQSLAPAGGQVLSANVLYTPYAQADNWDDMTRQLLLARCLNVLEHYAPGLRDLVIGTELLTPVDLEVRYGVSGGHWHHGDIALDQLVMMRPTYGAAQYRTPISGLFLCGAGSHPGGDLTGIPGHNAAKEILR